MQKHFSALFLSCLRSRFLNLKNPLQNTTVPRFSKCRRPPMLAISLSLFLLNRLISILAAYSVYADLSFLIFSSFSFSDAVSMYVRAGGKLCYLAAIQNAIPSASFPHTRLHPFHPSLLILAAIPPFSHPNLLLSSPYSFDLIPISYAASPRIQNSSRYL